MTQKAILNCWEILNCDNLDCLARSEPEIPCWEIAKRDEAYHNVSDTCKDCIVLLLKEKTSILSIKQLQNITKRRVLSQNTRTVHRVCIRKPTLPPGNINKSNHHFLLYDFIERKVFIENTWCELCDEANLAIFNQNEYEFDGNKFILGYCRRCGTKILSEIIEKNIEP